MKIAVMTDTNSGISPEEGRQLGVRVVPMPVLIDGKTYYEGVDLTQETFYESLLNGADVTTSQPAPGELLNAWEELLKEHDAVVYIPMSSGLSTSYQTALVLAEDFDGRVQVVNQRSISVPQRYGVMDALALAEAGKTAEDIRTALEETAEDIIIFIGVDTLKFLKKGGRVTPAAAAMGTVLQIKPLLQIRGERLDAFAKVRGAKACRERILKEMHLLAEQYQADGRPFSIAASGSFVTKEEADEWVRTCSDAFPGMEVRFDPLSCCIGSHTGPGAFAMGICRRLVPADG